MKLELYSEKIFDSIRHIDENGIDFWYARELMTLLGYSKWENFYKVIKSAIIACEQSNNNIDECFLKFRKTLKNT